MQLFTYVGAIDGDELGGIHAGLVGSLLWFAPSALPGGRLGPRAAGDVDRELVLLLLSLDLDPARSALAAHNAANIGVEQLAPDSGLVTLNGLAYGALTIDAPTAGERWRIHTAALGGRGVAALAIEHHPILARTVFNGGAPVETIVTLREGRHAVELAGFRAASAVLNVGPPPEDRAPPTMALPDALHRTLYLRSVYRGLPRAADASNSSSTATNEQRFCVYREFTDATGQVEAERDEHWGALGPPIYIVPHSVLNIEFVNECSEPTGVQFGALQPLGDTLKLSDELVPPGGRRSLHYLAPDEDRRTHLYQPPMSAATALKLRDAGLVGSFVVIDVEAELELAERFRNLNITDVEEEDLAQVSFGIGRHVALCMWTLPDGTLTLNGFNAEYGTGLALQFRQRERVKVHMSVIGMNLIFLF